jgi:anthranilate synthase component 1
MEWFQMMAHHKRVEEGNLRKRQEHDQKRREGHWDLGSRRQGKSSRVDRKHLCHFDVQAGKALTCPSCPGLLMYIHCHEIRKSWRKSPSMSRYRPSFEEFARFLGSASCIPVYRELTGDGLTPVSAFGRIARSAPSFLFESVIGGEKVGRFSFLGTEPFLTFEARGPEVTIAEAGDPRGARRFSSRDPFRDLEELVERYRAVQLRGLPRFAGGAVGYASYDAVRYTENLPTTPADDRGLADLSFAFYDRMVLFDHIRKTILVVAQAHVGPNADPRAAFEMACGRIDELVDRLAAPSPDLGLRDIDTDSPVLFQPRSNFTRAEYEAVVRRCQEYIKAGDIFQVVPSQRFAIETSAEPFDIYRALRVVNPSPFLFYLPYGEFALIGSSPEILVRVEDGVVTIRPLAGTRRRGADEAEDRALADELLADPKERAEHIMLVDLGRNDVGRVADYRTVRLTDVMKVERYSHVMHITSNVTGRLRAGQTAFDALKAGLPAGTVSGAPKVRAMQIIDEMEKQKRGPYAGAVGYIDFTGNMDTCIALRTLVIQGKTAYIQAGGGIVYDSDPATEYEETVSKARGLLKAIEIAESQLPR